MEFETKLYNPAAQPEEWLIEHFVVRTKVFKRIFNDIKGSTMEHPEQHYLIQGQRGMGKTTLLLRLKYEIERTDSLKDWVLPVFFNEESYDITSLSGLWEKLLKYFDDYFSDGGGYYNETDKYVGRGDYEQCCFDLVLSILRNKGKKLLILFDNFGELFLDNLDERESHRYREILMNCADMRIIAASSVVLESHNDYSEPFFDFFKIINLEGLKKDETVELIRKLQEKSGNLVEFDANKARIETLAILTGGVIRTIIMLYEILLNDHDGSALKDLEKILDAVTPLYKHRMEDLKPQQRRIMDVIAKNWDAISVKEIAESIRENGKPVESKKISAQLQELEKNNLVEKIKTSTKNNLYIVKERFFNIWYLMRHGDKTSHCKVKWLTRFLEMWYEKEDMKKFIYSYIKKLQSKVFISSSAVTITNALLASSKTDRIDQALLLQATENIISAQETQYLPQIGKKIIEEALESIRKRNYANAVGLLEQASPQTFQTLSLLGIAYFGIKKFSQAIECLSQIKDNDFARLTLGLAYYFSDKVDLALRELLASNKKYEKLTSNIIGDIYVGRENFELAVKYYAIASNHGDLNAMLKLSDVYLYELNDYKEAIAWLQKLINADSKNFDVRIMLASAYWLSEKPFKKIEKSIQQAIQLANTREELNYANDLLLSVYISERTSKEKALKASETLLRNEAKTITCAFALIWNLKVEEGVKMLQEIISSTSDDELDAIMETILLIASKKQYRSALKIFNENTINLKEKLKPMYFALINLLKDECPDEYLKMGKELEEPVKDILKTIEQYSVDYA